MFAKGNRAERDQFVVCVKCCPAEVRKSSLLGQLKNASNMLKSRTYATEFMLTVLVMQNKEMILFVL